MSYRPSYTSGSWLAICDSCGRQFKAQELQLRWDNLMVCQGDWEPRQPQDFVKGVADLMRTPWARPESSDQFIPINYTSALAANAVTSGCSMSRKVIVYDTSKHELNAKSINTTTIG
jgi:hypothetical protein